MAVIQSFGAVQSLVGPSPTWDTSSSVAMYDGYRQDYAKIYQTQPNVRTVVNFFSRNIAQLGIHAFRRISDTDRERLTGVPLTQTLKKPNPQTTRYRMIEHTVQDFCIYFNAYWLKVRARGGRLGLVRIPPTMMQVEGGLLPENYVLTGHDGKPKDFDPSEIVHFRGYDPSNPLQGLSPMETLRRILAEENAALDHRQGFWRNAAQMTGVIERPKEAGNWTPEQVREFQEMWASRYAGGKNAGKTPILQSGMTYRPTSFSADQSQYIESRKLSMEVCAAAWHVPAPLVGILDHATFSNIREQHKHLYMDCLGPTTTMMEEDLELQLVPEFEDTENVYLEFNIREKLKGSFEEEAASIRSLTGGKQIMTQNEGRARLNLPRATNPEADELSSEMAGAASDGGRPEDPDAERKQPERQRAESFSVAIRSMFARQQQRLAKVASEDRAAAFDVRRWTSELAADLKPLLVDAKMSLDDAEMTSWKVAGGVNCATISLLSSGKFEQCFTAARADDIAATLVMELSTR